MLPKKLLLPLSVVCLLLLAASCTVYAPMQPVMPLVSQRGQVEAGASVQVLGRVEATGSYSPIQHVVLTGGLTGSPRLGEEHFLTTAQYEVGAGFYQPLGQYWLLSGLGGLGHAYCHRGYVDLGVFGPGTYSEYEARYAKYFGQVGVARLGPYAEVSFTYRLVKVNFDYLNDSAHGPLPLSEMLRHELAGAIRVKLTEPWRLTFTAGTSVSGTPKLDDNLSYSTYGRSAYHANRNLLPAFLASIGVVYLLKPAPHK